MTLLSFLLSEIRTSMEKKLAISSNLEVPLHPGSFCCNTIRNQVEIESRFYSYIIGNIYKFSTVLHL